MQTNTNINWWEQIIELSKSTGYGDLKQKIDNITELQILNKDDDLRVFVKNNKDAWPIYRTWLKLNESNKEHIRKNKKLLSAVLDEPVTISNLEMFGPTISRIGNIPMWTHEHLEKFNNLIKDMSISDWFTWEMMHVTNEASSRYPWNIVLTNWCYQVQQQKLTVEENVLTELLAKEWSYKARCLITATIIKTESLKNLYSKEDLWEMVTNLNPKIVTLGKALFDDTDESLSLIANTLINETMSNRQKINERENNKIGKELLENIEFTFEW